MDLMLRLTLAGALPTTGASEALGFLAFGLVAQAIVFRVTKGR